MYDLGEFTAGYDPANDPDFQSGGDFSPLPMDFYPCIIDGAPEIKESAKKQRGDVQRGLIMGIKFKVMSGQYANRIIFGNFNRFDHRTD